MTGRHIWDEKRREWVHVSEAVKVLPNIWFPKSGTKYFDASARRWFHSKQEKRNWMEAKGLIEAPDDYGNPWRGMAESGKKKVVVKV